MVRVMTKKLLIGMATLLVLVVAIVKLEMWVGRTAVSELCQESGGVHINSQAEAKGLLEMLPLSGCALCVELLAEGAFDYVDFYASSPRASFPAGAVGFYRMTVANSGDIRCESYERAFQENPVFNRSLTKMKGDQCLALNALDGRPPGYVLDSTVRRLKGRFGKEVALEQTRLVLEPAGEVVAYMNNYFFTSTLSFDEGGRGGVRDAQCGYLGSEVIPSYTDFVKMAFGLSKR